MLGSTSVGQYGEYTKPLMSHLLEKKINHWDGAIREITAKVRAARSARVRAPILSALVPVLLYGYLVECSVSASRSLSAFDSTLCECDAVPTAVITTVPGLIF